MILELLIQAACKIGIYATNLPVSASLITETMWVDVSTRSRKSSLHGFASQI